MVERLRLIEPVPIEVSLVTALSHVEDIGFGGLLVFYRAERCYETGGTLHVVKHKIAIPHPGLQIGNPIVRAFIEGPPRGAPLRLIK